LPPGLTKHKIKAIFGINDLKNTGHEVLRKNNLKFDLIPKFFPSRPLCNAKKKNTKRDVKGSQFKFYKIELEIEKSRGFSTQKFIYSPKKQIIHVRKNN
jgi:hypothetical protein